jgi:hypothetical protein
MANATQRIGHSDCSQARALKHNGEKRNDRKKKKKKKKKKDNK